jgi:uncharacterized repeat protein (TIGR02059 family)
MAVTWADGTWKDTDALQFVTPEISLFAMTAAVTAADTIAPKFASGFVNGATVVLRFTESGVLDAAHVPSASSFNVSVNSVARGVSSVLVDPYARTVTLTLSGAVAAGQKVSVSYLDPTIANDVSAIQDAAGNDAASFAKSIVNLTGIADKIAPSFAGAHVTGSTLVMSYVDANPLDAVNVPLAASFHVNADGVAVGVAGVAVDASARTVTLTLASAVGSTQAVTVAYNDPGRGNDVHAIQDATGNDAITLRATAVINSPPTDTTAPQFASAAVNGTTLVMTYTEANLLDAAHAPGTGAFAVAVGGAADPVNAVVVDANAKTVTLTLANPTFLGQAVTVAYTDPTTGNDANAIQDASGNDAASLGATPVTNHSPPASVIELAGLDGSTGFRLDGVATTDRANAVSTAGDVNGDGFADLIVGAIGADPNGSNSGASYVVFGHGSGFSSSIELSALDGSTGFRLDGAAAGEYAGAVGVGGDVNGDGFDDLVVSAYGGIAGPNGTSSGASYVVFGHASGFSSAIELSALDGSTGFRLDGPATYGFSNNFVSAAGDLNGDGFADLIVGVPFENPNGTYSGASYVVFGSASGFASAIELSGLDGSTGFRLDGVAAYDYTGWSVRAAGDVNGDGLADLIVGAAGADPNGSNSGASYVVFGKASGFASAVDLSGLDGTTGFRLNGAAADDTSGVPVAAAGDVNGDGYADLIVAAASADPNGSNSGSTYVVFGKALGFASVIELSGLDGSTGFRLDGAATGDYAGASVSAAGDLNGDGYADLIVGAPSADPNGSDSGASYVVFGKASGFASVLELSALDGSTGFRLDGAATLDHAGRVSAAGDLNGDGFSDVAVGSLADPNGFNSGASYVIFGRNFTGAVSFAGTSGADLLNGGTSAAERFVAGDGNDSITGGGGADVIYGGQGNDRIAVPDLSFQLVDGGGGTDTLALSGSGIDLGLANERGRISGIEVIDLTGSGSNTLNLTARDLLNLADTGNTLTVMGNAGDAVKATGNWVDGGQAGGFHTYTQGQAVLKVSVAITDVSVFAGAALSTVELSSLNGTNGFRLDGAATLDNAGISVSAAGDINGDGFGDVIVGAVFADANAVNSGASYVVFGKASGFPAAIELSALDGTTGFRLSGVAAGDGSGRSVSDAGDRGIGDCRRDVEHRAGAQAGCVVAACVLDGSRVVRARRVRVSDRHRLAGGGRTRQRQRDGTRAGVHCDARDAGGHTIDHDVEAARSRRMGGIQRVGVHVTHHQCVAIGAGPGIRTGRPCCSWA